MQVGEKVSIFLGIGAILRFSDKVYFSFSRKRFSGKQGEFQVLEAECSSVPQRAQALSGQIKANATRYKEIQTNATRSSRMKPAQITGQIRPDHTRRPASSGSGRPADHPRRPEQARSVQNREAGAQSRQKRQYSLS